MATRLVVVAGVILFPSTRGLSRASRVRHFDLFYLMMLFFGRTRCSLSVLSGYLSEIEDIIKNLVVGCLWGIHWETSATVRLVCIDCSLIWKVIAVACVVLLSMLGCIVLLHLDLVQEILSGIETSIRWSAQTSTQQGNASWLLWVSGSCHSLLSQSQHILHLEIFETLFNSVGSLAGLIIIWGILS